MVRLLGIGLMVAVLVIAVMNWLGAPEKPSKSIEIATFFIVFPMFFMVFVRFSRPPWVIEDADARAGPRSASEKLRKLFAVSLESRLKSLFGAQPHVRCTRKHVT